MSEPEIDIAIECIKMMYCLTDFGVPALVARELGIMYRTQVRENEFDGKFNQFLLKTSYSWIVTADDFDYDKYNYAKPIRKR